MLMIATLTPAEYDAVGASIRVQKVLDVGHGAFEVRVYGRCADAEYVGEHQKSERRSNNRTEAGRRRSRNADVFRGEGVESNSADQGQVDSHP